MFVVFSSANTSRGNMLLNGILCMCVRDATIDLIGAHYVEHTKKVVTIEHQFCKQKKKSKKVKKNKIQSANVVL